MPKAAKSRPRATPRATAIAVLLALPKPYASLGDLCALFRCPGRRFGCARVGDAGAPIEIEAEYRDRLPARALAATSARLGGQRKAPLARGLAECR